MSFGPKFGSGVIGGLVKLGIMIGAGIVSIVVGLLWVFDIIKF